jgi:hypothetical protein
MNQKSRHHLHVLEVLALVCLGVVLWLRSDTNHVSVPAAKAAIARATWGVEDPLTRLLPIDSYAGPVGGRLAFTGARNEVVDKQLVLLAGPQAWAGVQLAFSDLQGPQGSVVSGTLLHWRRVGMVQTRKPYYDTKYVGLWPDPLLPAAPFDVAAKGRAFEWIDLHIPANTVAGDYTGTITISARNSTALKVPVTLHVWGFTMPQQNHLRTSFGVQGSGNRPLDMGALDDDMLAHRISPNNCVGDPNISTAGGHEQFDWTAFDGNMQRRLAQGVTSITVFIPDGDPSRGKGWQDHFRQKGWLDLPFTYVADEPESGQLAGLNDRLGQIKRASPDLKNLITARGYLDQIAGNVDIWCPDMIYFDPDASRRAQVAGKESWWYPAYPTHHPMINVWTDYPALDCRVWPWMTWKYNVDGMLYWTVCSWQNTPDPLTQASAFLGGDGPANGDGQLVYPGPDGKPLDSIRWEALRDGIQDYEVFCLLEAGVRELKASGKAPSLVTQAQALLAIDPAVVTSYKQYSPDPQGLLATREKMSRTAEQIVAALGREPQITARPRMHPALPHLQAMAAQAK